MPGRPVSRANHIWDLAKGQIQAISSTPPAFAMLLFDNKTLAAGCFDNSLRLYDLESRQLKAIGSGHTGGINSVAFTPDGKTLVTGGLDNHVKVWAFPAIKPNQDKPTEFKPFASLQEHNNRVYSVAISRDAKTIVSGGNDNLARIWDMPKPAADGKLLEVKKSRRVLRGHSRPVEAVAISNDGTMIATGSWDGEAGGLGCIREKRSSRQFQRFCVMSLAFSPDGKELAVGSGIPASRPDPPRRSERGNGRAVPGRPHRYGALRRLFGGRKIADHFGRKPLDYCSCGDGAETAAAIETNDQLR